MNQGFDGNSLVEYSVTSVLLYSFLEKSSNCNFGPQLSALGNQLKASKSFHNEGYCEGDLQTDGNRPGRFQGIEPGDEEIFRNVGAQLAEIGDRLALEIEPSLMNGLVQQFRAENFSREEIIRYLSEAVQTLARRMPMEMDPERTMLVAAMVLARNVANTVPSLLHRVFVSTVNYINYNLRDHVNNLAPEG
ncbi:BH3-interacting domain death agonist [Heteronotia binoei]|uniref:BH3-interacting domain death agonist n=1 Tax=Heteronotia binoei TaxID=13085 RepID=UPI002931AAD5|nr:BH3-interacting domain death agonist [Heteronotia binoei]